MNLYLQMGHGMMEHARELISNWGGGTTIFSPKNMTLKQMKNLSTDLRVNNGSIMIDPQFYVPRTSQKNLHQHSFWPQNFQTNIFFNGSGVDSLVNSLLNDYVIPTESSAFIIPTLYLSDISKDWNNITEIILNSVEKAKTSLPEYLTLCLGEEILLSDEKTHELIEQIEDYPVAGFYIIPIHPRDFYLVDNSSWLLNLLDIIASLKTQNKKVIVGYSGHQSLVLSLAKVDAICAGTWLKTRRFPLKDFDESTDEAEGGRRKTWYYCPQSLSEYQIQFLDVANRTGVLNSLKVPKSYNSSYADILFGGAQPTTVNFSEREAFRHYLNCLRTQCFEVSKKGYIKTRDYLKLYLETAFDLANYFHQNGVRANDRDFANVADSTLSAVDAFDSSWGLNLQANWDFHSALLIYKDTFDYSNHDGFFTIGSGMFKFKTRWAKASNTLIHCYTDNTNICRIALAPKNIEISDIKSTSEFNFSSTIRSAEIDRIIILQNTKKIYAALKIISIMDDLRGDEKDELSFECWIQTNGSDNFEK